MKVNVGTLKANLSSYLRQVEREHLVVEVCVRDEAVAYLVPAAGSPSHPPGEDAAIRASLERQGLALRTVPAGRMPDWTPRPVPAPDGDTTTETVRAMRSGKDW